MNKNPGFFRTVFSVCSGTEVFVDLMKRSCGRAFFHLIILCLFCSTTAVVLQYANYEKLIGKYCGLLFSEFGEARFSKDGVFPSVNPEKARFQRIAENRIDYIPDRKDSAVFDPSDSISERGVLWTPKSVVLWVKSGTDYYAIPLFFSFASMPVREKFTEDPGAKIYDYAERNAFKPSRYDGQPPINFLKIQGAILTVMLLFVFGNILMSIMFFIPMFSVFFSMVFFFTGKQELPDEVKFTNLLTVAIYASFPGMIIATLYYGLNLPFVDFQTVCLAGFLIYLIVVLNKLKNLKNPKPLDNRYRDDDDDNF